MRPIADRLTPTVRVVMIATTLIYLFYVVVRPSRAFMETHLALGPRLFAGELWQPATSLFVHLDFVGFFLGMLGVWFIGSFVEQVRGSRRIAALFVCGGALANLAIAAAYWLRGFGPVTFEDGNTFAVTTLFVAFARIYGRQQVQFWPTPIFLQARYLLLIMIGWMAAASVAQGKWPSLAGLAVAIVVGYFGAGPGGLAEIRSFFAQARDVARARRLRRRFGVIQGGERRPKKYVN
jgi:membrane associated rhomboid family serine protease